MTARKAKASRPKLFPYSTFNDVTIKLELTSDEAHCLFVALDDCRHFRKQHAESCRKLEAERDDSDTSPVGSWNEAADRSEAVAATMEVLRERIFGRPPISHPLPSEVRERPHNDPPQAVEGQPGTGSNGRS